MTTEAVEEFRRLAAVAGGTRDWDIVGDRLNASQKSGASLEPLMDAFRQKRARAIAESQALIQSADIEAFLHAVLFGAQTTLQLRCCDLPIRAFAQKRVRPAQRTLQKRSTRAIRDEQSNEENLHDVRKGGRKLR